jgi:phosphodiesterase/alkaline phosphatase D-like protein
MNRLLLALTLATFVTLLAYTPGVAQIPPPVKIPPPAKKPQRVEITQAPALEMASDDFAIVRWKTNNPGGTDVHFGVVQYGTDPKDLSQIAKSPIAVNRGHTETTFRVRMPNLKPRTTYYYAVTSTESDGTSDGVISSVGKFTTARPGERIAGKEANR